ncbi:MAG: trypsin-like peptidase domain-containing protein [Clostridium sp.]|nr:trypsin-like peptidase domain-containing protein [Clostridium sp.]
MSPGYTPPSLLEPSVGGIGGIQPFVVIGTDDRISIPSPDESGEYRNTVYISTTLNGITYGASGFMIGPNAVATSGHVVYNATHGWITSATVTPARRSSNPISPYGTATAIAYECGYNYANGGSADDDWGIIYLDSNIGYSVGWLGLRWQSASYNDSSVSLIGYPGQVNGTDTETMHKSVGTIAESSNRTLRSADLDTSTGNSGGPWYRYYDSTGYTAISIHRGWILNNNTYYNDSTRIDQWLYDKLVSCRTSTL